MAAVKDPDDAIMPADLLARLAAGAEMVPGRGRPSKALSNITG